ncbi:MAG: prolyl oligopeptidase family serine peptidase [Flavobacteriales bacterium]|nr:prolyl oligopeptidase family serine peptidase [Flavobacteriales bacterium]
MKFLKQALITILLFSSSAFFAQNTITLKGKVQDSISGVPLAFSYLTLKGFALGTVTNGEGEFIFNIPIERKTETVVFSYLGYRNKTRTIEQLQQLNPILIQLNMSSNNLREVVVKPRKKISAKQLLRRVVQNIESNYSQEPVFLDAYYRETISENGAFIKYSDASVISHYDAYRKKGYKWKDFRNSGIGNVGSLSSFNYFGGARLHRIHFNHRTIANDQVKVIDSRSSDNLTTTAMNANIEGGPLSILGRDRLKYKHSFLGEKKFKKFNYELGEVRMPGKGWVYVLTFQTKMTAQELEETSDKRRKKWNKAHRNKLLKGKIYIDQDSYAVLRYECSIPSDLKKYFRGYKTMAIKHFDYKLTVEYQKKGDRYYLKKMRHEDEFIYKDTVSNNTTPYIAVSELWVTKVKKEGVKKYKNIEVFENISANQLYDLPLDYDSTFWATYTLKHKEALIPDSIRRAMEEKKSLEQQFRDKHLRDESLEAPIAKIKPFETKIHDEILIDNYAWMKDTKSPLSNPDIKEYVEAENAFTDNYFIPLRKDQRELFEELSARVDKEDESLAIEKDGYEYTTKYIEEGEYPIFLRNKVGDKKQDTLLDVNKLAIGKEYYSAGGINMSPNTSTMAFYENTTGSDKYIVKFKFLDTGLMSEDSLTDVSGIVWLNHNSFLYTEQEPKTNRVYQVKKHTLGSDQKQDSILFEEKDQLYSVSINRSKSKDYIYLASSSTNNNEIKFMKTSAPEEGFILIETRGGEHEYGVTDYKGEFYISTNMRTDDYEIMKCSVTEYQKNKWKKFMKPSRGARLTSFVIFDKYWVIGESKNMENNIRVIEKENAKEHKIKFRENLATISIGSNRKYDSDTLRYSLQSMKSPVEIYNYNMATKKERLIKKQEVKNYNKSPWIKQERVWATAKDGTQIPITLLYRKYTASKHNDFKRVYLTSYGSYGSSSTPGFNHSIYTLINRGFIYAIAHIRGGGELGKKWHDGGKMMSKKNTFTDFIDCAEFLVEEGFVKKGNIVAEGGSAGGLLMGAVANMRPDLFKLIFLNVPFVDVINTMLDDKLPLTTLEYEEWGNPNYKKHFDYIKTYSPYENVKAQEYPNMIFSTGINDTRVGYWEPAKMVAKLRKFKTDDNLLLLKTNLSAGHGGGSGRYSFYRDLAYQYAIMFDIFSNDIKEEADAKAANN